MKPTPRERLEHILAAIENIESFCGGKFGDMDTLTASAVYYQLVIIGEAARHVPEETRQFFMDIPWLRMMGLRNVLAHEYFGLKQERIATALSKLPTLKKRLQEVIDGL